MPRVRQVPTSIQPQAVNVIGQIFGAAAGQVVLVTLERQCTWHGQLVPMRLETKTEATGRFSIQLPPSEDLATIDDSPVPHYVLEGPGLRRMRFVVPAGVPDWKLSL